MNKNLVYMTPEQVNDLKTEIASLEKMLASDKASRRPKIQDEAEFMSDIRKKKELLKNHEPQKLTGAKASRALKRAREIESELKDSLLPRKDYYQDYPKAGFNSDFERAVNEEMRRMRDVGYKQKIFEYKRIMRQLDPSDPTLTNIERFRR